MPNVALYNVNGEQVGEIMLNDAVFGVEVNNAVMHAAVVNFLANQRRGTSSTKQRGEVSGGGKKPWRQKGTGRARHGSTRSPLWTGGGIVFGPKPRDYSFVLPKKVKRLAIKSALSAKVANNKLIALENITLSAPKTKEIVKMLANLKLDSNALILIAEQDPNVQKSARNIAGVKAIPVNNINTYDLLKYENLIMTKGAIDKVEEVLA